VDDKGVRVFFPELTGETRTLLAKTAKGKLEDARISLRQEREKVITDVKTKEKDGLITEDERFRITTDLQKIIDDVNVKLDELLAKKEKEIAS
jgi:ribosome recycling factor